MYPFFKKNIIYSHDDFAFHRMRLEGYYEAVSHGSLFPKIFPNMANGYGYAADLFYPSLLLLPYVFLRFLNLTYIQSYYGYQTLIVLATFVISYKAGSKILKDSQSGFLFSLVYTTATYRLVDQFIRGALGETLAFAVMPIVLLGAYSIFVEEKDTWITLGLGMFLLIQAHMISAFLAAIFIGLTFLYKLAKKQLIFRIVINLFKATILGFLSSSYVLLPILEQVNDIKFNFMSSKGIWPSGLKFSPLTLFNNSLANTSGNWGDLGPGIGIVLLTFLILGTITFSKLEKQTKLFLSIGILLSILSTNIFPWIYLKSSWLSFIQFPWRILLFSTLFLSLALSTWLVTKKKILNTFIIVLLIITASFSSNVMYNFENKDASKIDNTTYSSYAPQAIGGGLEYLTAGTDYKFLEENFADNSIWTESYTLQLDSKTFNKFNYDNQITYNDASFVIPKVYYLGYTLLIDGNPAPYFNKNGLVACKLTKGVHKISIEYTGTNLQRVSLAVSFFSLLFIVIWKILLAIFTEK